MNPEEKKKFVEKCCEADDLAIRAIEKMCEAMVYPYTHPAYPKIFEKALEKMLNEP